ncbi:MAG: hypothetical protein P1U89_21930 [Verrucomicrobiales bacterium]|nr:hypothetical protein [Verrucomicrobiales bacterium]
MEVFVVMTGFRIHFYLIALTVAIPFWSTGDELKSGEFFTQQSWSQETDFDRLWLVNLPQNAEPGQKLPVFLFLHGNGGNARAAMMGFLRRHPRMAESYILVFPQGYQKSWNIISERSRANDLGFIEEIIETLATFDNVDPGNFSVMGSSNGAALVNQIAIESKNPRILNYITAVSQLNGFQHDGTGFKAKGAENDYGKKVSPLKGKRILNISGVEDRLVPYNGGPSRVIPAKGGKLPFLDAEESIFLWARQMGYQGEKLSKPTRAEGDKEIFSYLDGDVIHYKISGAGHGATGALTETELLAFLTGSDQ